MKYEPAKYAYRCIECDQTKVINGNECSQTLDRRGRCPECFDRLLREDINALSRPIRYEPPYMLPRVPTKEEIERLEKQRIKNKTYEIKRKEYLKEIEPLLARLKQDKSNNLCFHIYDCERYTNVDYKTLVKILDFFGIKLEREHLLKNVYKSTLYEIKEKLNNKDVLMSFNKKFNKYYFYKQDGGLKLIQKFSKLPLADNHKLFWN